MIPDLKIDDRAFRAALRRFEVNSKRNREAVLKDQARLFVQDVILITPPNKNFKANRKGGEAAVSSDIRKILRQSKAKDAVSDPSDSLEHSLNAASPLLPARYRPEFKTPPGSDGPDQPIIYADPSQRSAVRQSRTSRLMVMDGPPGTGKSQTIVNLVADALAKGERVAIICEKRVALDVVKQRLVGAGIGHLSAVVHDVYDDRKALYTHIADRLEVTERRTFVEDALSALRAEARRLEDQISQRNELMASATGSGFVLGALHVMAASFDVPPIASPGLTSLDHPALLRLLKGVKELHPFARFWNPCSVFLPGEGMPDRPLLASESTVGLHTILQNLRAAKDAAFAYGNYYGSQPLDPETLESAEPVLRLVASMMAKSSPDKAALGRMTTLRLRNPSAVASTEQALETLADRRIAAEAETTRVEMEESNELIASLSIAARHANTFWRFIFPSWRKACTTLREALVKQWPEQAGAKMDVAFLSALTQRVQAAGAWRAADTLFKTQPSHRKQLGEKVVMDGLLGTCHSAGCEKTKTHPPIGIEIQRFAAALQPHSNPPCADAGEGDRRG